MTYIDPVEVSPDVYRVLLENDTVRVLDMTLPAGQTDNQHSHPSETVIFLQGGKAEITLPDGEVVRAELPDGHIMWNGAWTHTVKNAGDADIRAIIVESKS